MSSPSALCLLGGNGLGPKDIQKKSSARSLHAKDLMALNCLAIWESKSCSCLRNIIICSAGNSISIARSIFATADSLKRKIYNSTNHSQEAKEPSGPKHRSNGNRSLVCCPIPGACSRSIQLFTDCCRPSCP